MLKTFFLLLTSAIILNSYSIPCVYDDCFGVYNGSFIVKKDGKIVCVDENNKEIMPFDFEKNSRVFSDG